MKPLKQTTALAALSTSSLVFVPQAFAAGEEVVAAAPAFPFGPVAIAAASAVAAAGFIGWGMKTRKYRKLEESYNRRRTQKALRPATRHYSPREIAGAELEATFASRLRGNSQIIIPGQKPESTQKPASAKPAYVPRHAKGQAAPVQARRSESDPGITSSDMLSNLEEKYSEIINRKTELPQVAELPRVEAREGGSGARAGAVARRGGSADATADRRKESQRVLAADAELEEYRASDFDRVYARSYVDAVTFGPNTNELISRLIPRVDQYMLARHEFPDASAAEIDEMLAKHKAREAAAAEIAAAGKRAEQATAQAALAVKSAGYHAAIDVKAQDKEEPFVPVHRGPGFVDVNDQTFIRNSSRQMPRISFPQKKAAGAENLSTGLGGVMHAYTTDAVSDFPLHEMNKTYYTQGDMVSVNYSYGPGSSQGFPGSGPFVVHSGNDGTVSGYGAFARTSVTALPVV